MTRTSGSTSASSMAVASSSRSSGVMVLYCSARVRTIDRTPPSVSVRKVVGIAMTELCTKAVAMAAASVHGSVRGCGSGGAAAGLVDGGVAGMHDRDRVVGDDGHVEGHELVALALGDLLHQRAGGHAVAVVHQSRVLHRALDMDP